MKKILTVALIAVLSLALPACSTMQKATSSVEGRLLVHAATAQVIDGNADTALRVLQLVGEAREFVDGAKVVSVAGLALDVRSKIDWHELEPASQVLLHAILLRAEHELSARVGAAELSAEGRMTLHTMFTMIETAARGVRVQ